MPIPPTAVLLLCLLTALLGAGCSTAERAASRPLSVAIAVKSPDGAPLSPEQLARVHQAVQPELTRAGYTLAPSPAAADLVVTVGFIPIPGGSGGHVKFTAIEPTGQFLRATDGGDTSEAKEWRRREREFQRWVENQTRADRHSLMPHPPSAGGDGLARPWFTEGPAEA